MNRLKPAPVFATKPASDLALGCLTAAPWYVDAPADTRTARRHATFAPAGYEPGYRYPLVVWLHSQDSTEAELPQVMPHISLQNFVAVAPRGTARSTAEGYRWSQSLDGIAAAEDAVFASIAKAEQHFAFHNERVFLAGVGAGGAMALRIALRQPEWFAGAASLGGPLPRGRQPLGRLNAARQMPLLLSAARGSQEYPEPRICRDLSLLHSAGFSVDLRQYPAGDEVTTGMLEDLNRWIMGRLGCC
ncbi:alpha/beta hydrolase [Botrimarina hoheduenensis]|uniref:Esterase PHB depolymerase n=1 Tax=Botrimarina hoheduenensis TaxID=2528000 RepID=A0A5C5W087_9BACT|nr:PHB depolymerase family esterase [Botrimarina hoheduenensis]TWT43172.1 Esterase PHB depolymerase [Botrimarina hoheduenensis]